MQKQRPPPSNTTVPDLLNAFAKGMNLRGNESQESLKDLLSQLPPPQCQAQFVPLPVKLGECNGIDVKVNEGSVNYSDSNDHKQVERSLKQDSKDNNILRDNHREKTSVEDTEKGECLRCLMDDMALSFDNIWLRNYLRLPLKMAIKEIIAKKPQDPINYLGFWLLNYRKCQENKKWQLKADRELDCNRSLIREPVLEAEEKISVDKGEEEGITQDWNFKYYDAVSTTA